MPKDKIVSIAGFWRNDQPDGIGIMFDERFGDLDSLAEVLEHGVRQYQQQQFPPDMVLDQLKGWGKNKPLADGQAVIALVNIAYLERMDWLVPDEWNGMIYAREYQPRH